MKIISKILGFFAGIAVSFGKIFNKDDVSANPAGRGTAMKPVPVKGWWTVWTPTDLQSSAQYW